MAVSWRLLFSQFPVELNHQILFFQKAERKTSKRGSILTYTNKTLKQHWEEYIGNEDPHKVTESYLLPNALELYLECQMSMLTMKILIRCIGTM